VKRPLGEPDRRLGGFYCNDYAVLLQEAFWESMKKQHITLHS
jgi:hypothetical protein